MGQKMGVFQLVVDSEWCKIEYPQAHPVNPAFQIAARKLSFVTKLVHLLANSSASQTFWRFEGKWMWVALFEVDWCTRTSDELLMVEFGRL